MPNTEVLTVHVRISSVNGGFILQSGNGVSGQHYDDTEVVTNLSDLRRRTVDIVASEINQWARRLDLEA